MWRRDDASQEDLLDLRQRRSSLDFGFFKRYVSVEKTADVSDMKTPPKKKETRRFRRRYFKASANVAR